MDFFYERFKWSEFWVNRPGLTGERNPSEISIEINLSFTSLMSLE